jgi:hypothetical protein
MPKNFKYRNKPCGYCGKSTGERGEGDHVIPKTLYPTITDLRVQRAKIPCCPECNDSWQRDEGHFRTVIDMCGPKMTAEREEIWRDACRSFRRPDGGTKDREAIAELLVPQEGSGRSDESTHKIFPLKDQRILRVLRKIVRGLTYRHTGDIIADENRAQLIDCNVEAPPEHENELIRVVYHVPRVFTAWAFVTDVCVGPTNIHSIWNLRFFDDALFAAIVLRSDQNEKPGHSAA